MKNKIYLTRILFVTLLMAISLLAPILVSSQTTVFSDDFTTSKGTSYTTTAGPIGTSTIWSMNTASSAYGAKIDGGILNLANSSSSTGAIYAYTSVPFNTQLNLNPGVITWTFNIRQIRTNPSGWGVGSYAAAVILASSSSNALSSGTGYAITYGESGTPDPIYLIRYNGGIRSGTQTTLITSNTSGLTTFGSEYISVKVTYTPSTNTWQMYLRNDGNSAFSDPASGTLTSQGTVVNSTYTGTSLAFMGAAWNGSSTSNQTAFFDNFKITVVKLNQSITFGALSNKTFGDPPSTLAATGGASGNPVVFTSSNNAVATCTGTNGSILTIVGAGTCTIYANQSGNLSYNSATQVSQSFTVNQAGQTISFSALSSKTFGNAPFSVSAIGGASGNPVTFTSSNNAIATCTGTNGATITITGAGTCTIYANQAGNTNYSAASQVGQSLTVSQASQSISFSALASKTFGDAPFSVSATGGASGNPVTFSSSDLSVATCTGINGATVTIIGAGTCTIYANQAGNSDYSVASQVGQSLTVSQASQSISFSALTSKTFGDAPFSVSATGGASGNPVTFTSSDLSVATCTGINGATVTIIGAGTCTIYANQAGNSDYSAASQVGQSLTVSQAGQTISFSTLPSKTFGDAPFSVSATGGASGNQVTFTSSNNAIATCTGINGATITIIGAGTCTIYADQTGNSDYSTATQIGQSLTIDKASQEITFLSLPNVTFGDAPFSLSASSSSLLTVSYSSSNSSVATISGNIVTITGVGTATITASQAGNTNYDAASPVQQTLTVSSASYNVTFNVSDGTLPISGASITFNSITQSSDNNGNVTFIDVPTGNNLPYSITKIGYNNSNGTLNLINQNINQNIVLTIDLYYTKLRDAYCGITISNLNSYILCDPVAGADDFQYNFVNLASSYDQTIVRGAYTTSLYLNTVPGLEYGKTYDVKVKAHINGVWDDYGPVCQITISSATTKLRSAYCGGSVNSITDLIYCEPVYGATDFQYNFVNTASSYDQTVTRGTATTSLYLNTVPGLSQSTTYDVKIKAKVGGVWGNYGDVCQLTILGIPNTKLRTAYCGITINSKSNYILCDPVGGATDFQYNFSNTASGYNQTVTRGQMTTSLYLYTVPGLSYGKTYDVVVRAKVGGVWGNFGTVCQITMVSPTKELQVIDPVSMSASPVNTYPNPFSDGFKIKWENNVDLEKADISIYDITGKKVFFTSTEISEDKTFGQNLTSGMYFVEIKTSDGNTEVFKMTKTE